MTSPRPQLRASWTRHYLPFSDGKFRLVRVSVVFPIDPAKLSTAQQKKFSWSQRRVFPNAKVARGKKAITALALPAAAEVQAIVPRGTPVRMTMTFYFGYPKGTAKKRLVDDVPQPQHGDADNRGKAPVDALTAAGWWPDDRFVTAMTFRKRLTTGHPRIVVDVEPDA